MNSSINPLVDFSIKIVSSKKDSVAVLKSQKSMKMFTNTHNLPSNESSNMLQVNYSVEWNNITFSIPSKSKARRVILKSLSGSANSGEMTAIMGPSGAGKTSLMNILAGFRGHGSTGEVKINNIKRNAKHKRLSCYIMQEDHLVPTLNVLETMMVAANLKLSKHLNASQKLSNVNDILEKLGLTECKYTRVTKISGGQRKRLCIAQELVNNPPILYLDEPTSGLDSSSSYQCLLLLKQLSLEGKTIICTIHQPSARLFELFDKLYMLADGCCLYDGKVNDLLPYLNSHGFSCPSFHNPADFMTEIASGEHEISYMRLISSKQNGESVAKYCMEEENGEIWKPINRIQGPEKKKVDNILPESLKLEYLCNDIGLWTQFYVLFVRALKATLRDGILMKLRLSAHIVVGVLIGIIYKDIGNDAVKVLSNAGFIFFSMLFLLFASMMPTVLTFPLEMKVFHREHLNHWYSIKAYYLAKTMADIPFQLIFPSIYTSIVYWMTGQPNDISRFFIFLSISVLVSLVSQSLGLIIGAATSIQNAVFLGPITAVPMLLFSGFFVHLDTIPHYLHWLSYLSYIRYAFEGSLICIYGMSREDLDCNVTFCLYKEPSKYLEDMDIDTTQMTWYYDVLGLIIFFLIIRFVGYLILKIKSLHKRNLLCSRCF